MRSDFTHLSQFVGSDTIKHYMGDTDAPLVLGKQRFSYVEIAKRTGLPAGRTARVISRIATAHRANSIIDLYNKTSPSSIADAEFGAGSCTVLMLFRLFESEDLDVKAWARRAMVNEEGKDNFTLFVTYKKRELAADSRTAKTPAAGPREREYRKAAMKAERQTAHHTNKKDINGNR